MRHLHVIAAITLLSSPTLANAQDGPVIHITPPPPPIRAAGADVAGPLDSDTYAASLGTKAFSNVVVAIREEFDSTLADYPSTRFKAVRFGFRNADRIVCGFYNAKNRMGAYVGWSAFYAYTSTEGFRIRILNPDDPLEYTYRWHCGDITAWVSGDQAAALTYKP